MPELVARASALVTEETGLVAPGSPDVAVIAVLYLVRVKGRYEVAAQ